ncbi:MAG: glycosyltransferase family 2 protein [Chloroflexi bacterium]|nr:glycosyltransferase family 2 protein [Chloroflexota bacterium]
MNKRAQPSSSKILVIIPAYNESERIHRVIMDSKAYLPVLVVDDGSGDDTSSIARTAGAEVIRQEPNQGKGAALLRGFQYALDKGFDAVITLDADGQHDPAEIPTFVDEFSARKSGLIIGQRDFRKMPFPRNFSNTLGTYLFSWALGQYVPDNQSGYRLHSRRLIEASLASTELNFEFEVEIILRCKLLGYSIAWVPIQTIYAGEKSHIKPLRHSVHFFRMIARTRKTMQKEKTFQK